VTLSHESRLIDGANLEKVIGFFDKRMKGARAERPVVVAALNETA
jgi:hypothetical protein